MINSPEQIDSVPSEFKPTFKKRVNKSRQQKRPLSSLESSLHSSDHETDSATSEEDHRTSSSRVAKRPRKVRIDTGESTDVGKVKGMDSIATTKYEADSSSSLYNSNDATKQNDWFDNNAEQDTISKNDHEGQNSVNELYRGSRNYRSFLTKDPNAPARSLGPVKAPTNLRAVTITDFAPDVCKDYKKTGFCGFGDSCKFLHAREDYKQGWQLALDWENEPRRTKNEGKTTASAGGKASELQDPNNVKNVLDSVPFACVICKKAYQSPIVTKCEHYFCENCALQRYRKTPNCAICGISTGGIFNTATSLKRMLENQARRN